MATKTDDKRAPLIDNKLARSDSDMSLGRAASINVEETGDDEKVRTATLLVDIVLLQLSRDTQVTQAKADASWTKTMFK